MAERRPTPDILGGLLDGNNAVKTERHNTIKTVTQKDVIPENHKVVKTPRQQNGIEENQKDVKTAKQQAVNQDVASENASKTKATFYVADEALNKLEEIWLQLRQAAPAKKRAGISKSGIIEAALLIVARDLDDHGNDSAIARALNRDKGESDASS